MTRLRLERASRWEVVLILAVLAAGSLNTHAIATDRVPGGQGCATVGHPCEGLRPGALMIIAPAATPEKRDYCTFGFLLRGRDGHRYAASAGHCIRHLLHEGEERVWADGSGTFAYTADGQRVGEFVYAIRTREIVPAGLPPDGDLSLVRLDRGVEADPEVCAWGGPTGVDDRIVTDPSPIELRWFGITPAGGRTPAIIPGPHAWLAPARSGYARGMPRDRIVQVSGHSSFGDSGGPVVDAGGRAVGLISGPPAAEDPDELPTDGHAGTFVVTRLSPQLARASTVLGIRLSLCCGGPGGEADGGGDGHGNLPGGCVPCGPTSAAGS